MSDEAVQPDLPNIEETPATHPHFFIEVRTPELVVIQEGNDAGFEVLTGKILTSYRKRRPEDGSAEFVLEPPKSRPVHDTIIEGEDYKTFVQNVLNHTPTVLDAKRWIGAGSHESPPRPSRHPGPTERGPRSYPLYDGEGEGWI